MCFYIPNRIREAKKATKDIICYKILKKNNKPLFNNLRIDGKIEKYENGYIYKETNFNKFVKLKSNIGKTRGKDGFHSYTKYSIYVQEIIKTQNRYNRSKNIVKMIIPKGAWYFENKECCHYYSSKIYFP